MLFDLRPTRARIAKVDRRHLWPGLAAFLAALALALVGLGTDARGEQEHLVEIQLLGVNDLHGHLEAPDAESGAPGLGGAVNLADALQRAASDYPGRTVRVHAGDMVGASPLVSSRFRDEPAMKAMNLMGFDAGTFGNHEFDEGSAEALRLLRGANFPYVSANVADSAGRPLVPPYRVVRRAGIKLGIIGVTTVDAPKWLLPRHARKLRFRDISDSVNRYVPALQRRGVEAIVVLAHAGGPMESDPSDRAQGEVISEAAEMDSAVDVVVAGHSHSEMNEKVANAEGEGSKLVVQAECFGRAFDRVKLTVDRRSGEVVAKSAEIEPVKPVSGHGSRLSGMVRRYERLVAPLAQRVIGRTTEDLVRKDDDGGRGDLGTVIADGQRSFAGTDVAFVDQTNMRGDLEEGQLTYADVSAVQGYESDVMRFKLEGSAVRELFEQGASDRSAEPLYSSGLSYANDLSGIFEHDTGRIELEDGRVLRSDRTYSVAANELLVTGDRFPAFGLRKGAFRRLGTDREALAKWFTDGAARRWAVLGSNQ